jgi:hypothetical protein
MLRPYKQGIIRSSQLPQSFLCLGLGEGDGDEGEALFAPGGEAALEGADALDAVFS